jgi:hypothetical protein
MNTFDFDQRVEEIQIALAGLFSPPKAPSVQGECSIELTFSDTDFDPATRAD